MYGLVAANTSFPSISSDVILSSVCSERTFRAPSPQDPAFVVGKLIRKFFDFWWNKLPSFSLPGAEARPMHTRKIAECARPKGNFEKECDQTSVEPSSTGQCLLIARCNGLTRSIVYAPHGNPTVNSRNGVLQLTYEAHIVKPEPEPVIESSKPIISVDDAGNRRFVYPIDWPKDEHFRFFQQLVREQYGEMYFAPRVTQMEGVFRLLFGNIAQVLSQAQTVEIAMVFDSARMMRQHIIASATSIYHLQTPGLNARIALLEYHDRSATIVANFTFNLNVVEEGIRDLGERAAGDNDQRGAALDALAIAPRLNWLRIYPRLVILIGGQASTMTQDGRSFERVLSDFNGPSFSSPIWVVFTN